MRCQPDVLLHLPLLVAPQGREPFRPSPNSSLNSAP